MQIPRKNRFLFGVLIVALAFAPIAIGMPNGAPSEDNNGQSVDIVGCTCHGVGYPANGEPSDTVVVQISGVPWAYEPGISYQFTINVDAPESVGGGFLLKVFTPSRIGWTSDQQIKPWLGTGEDQNQDFSMSAISHSSPDNKQWVFTWTAPESSTAIDFVLIGNAVNGANGNDDGDHWEILNFDINPPSSEVEGDDDSEPLVRTISSTDYDYAFASEEDPEVIEANIQAANMKWIFENGTIAYFATLIILIVGAVVQREFYESRFGGGPPHLDISLAVPQGIRRSVIGIIALYVAVSGWTTFDAWILVLLFGIAIFAAYGVYRTVRMARAPPTVDDVA